MTTKMSMTTSSGMIGAMAGRVHTPSARRAASNGARPYHHGNLRAELLAAAEQTVRERGVEALSLRELARRVGVSHGAPRRHFADRQALLDALAQAGFDRLGLVLFALVQGIAALVTGGMVQDAQLQELVADATAQFLRGSRVPA